VTFDVEVRGRRHHVELLRTAEGDHVSIDGRIFSGAMVGATPFWSLLIEHAEGGRRTSLSHEVAFDRDQSGTLLVNVDGAVVPVRMVDRRRSQRRSDVAEAVTGTRALQAPMPGRIVRVLVDVGDRVEARQPVAIMEAMKMENELHAPLAGTVTAVHVQAGEAVEVDAVLLVVTSGSDTGA
jgi:biotin carboxyl carrier protein